MRTTLIIADPVFKRAKAYALKHDKNLSEVVTEALDERLSRDERAVREPRPIYTVKPVSMGKPIVDVSDRDALYRIMDER